MARLIIRYPNNIIREVEFDQPRYRVGTAPDNDLVLEHEEVSSHQAEIESAAGGYTLVDVSEQGTTLVNGKSVERTPITYGDRISFGPVVGLFYPAQKKAMGERTRILLYLASGGAVILLSIALIFLFTTRRITTEVTERIGEPVTEQAVSERAIPGEQAYRFQAGEERVLPEEEERPPARPGVEERAPAGKADGLFDRLSGLFGGRRVEAELRLPEADPEIIRKRRAVAVPRGLGRLFFRKIPVPVEVPAETPEDEPREEPGEQETGREPEQPRDREPTRRQEPAPVQERAPEPVQEPVEEQRPAGPEEERGLLGRLFGRIGSLFGGGQEELPAQEEPAPSGEPSPMQRQAPAPRGQDAPQRQVDQAPIPEEQAAEQAARDFQRVTDPLSAIRRADLPEIRDLDLEEEPIYPEEQEPGRENLLGQVALSEIESFNMDVLWSYPPAFQESAPIMRTGALARIDDDRLPDLVIGTGENRLIALSGGEGAELFVQDMEGPFLEPVAANLGRDRYGEIFIMYEDGPVSMLDRDLAVQWTHTGERFSALPLLVDVNGDGVRDLVAPTIGMELIALDGTNGFELWRFYDAASEILHPPVALDINRDGVQDVLFATRGGALHALDGKTGWGLWEREVSGKPAGPPVVADVSGDGEKEVLCLTDSGVISAHSAAGRLLFAWETGRRYRAPASAGDVDGDGNLEIVLVDEEGVLRVVSPRSRREKWSFPSDEGMCISRIALADCDGRDGPEVVLATVSGAVFVLDGTSGTVLGAFNSGGYLFTTPLVADVNGDRANEVLVSSYRGEVFALQLAGARRPWFRLWNSSWMSLHHDYYNSGAARRYIPFLEKR
jgi:outer membrane protein assembly factor BamB/pSer/pThr/pTyr-binding forkhead associated (FHA) protein